MQVQVEDVGPCKKLLRIEIPAERVTQQLEEAYKQLSDTVVVPGFRKGHAPRRLMERKFGKQVNDDARGVLMSESFGGPTGCFGGVHRRSEPPLCRVKRPHRKCLAFGRG